MAIKKDRSELPTSKPKAGGGWQPDEETIFGPLLIKAFMEMEGVRPDKERHYVSPSNALSCARQLSYRAAGTPGKPMEPSGWWVTSLGKFVHRVLEDALLDEFGPEGCTPEAMIGTKVPLLDDEHAPQCEQCQRQMVADIAEWYCEFHPDESAPMKYRVEPEILTLTVMVDGEPTQVDVPIIGYGDIWIHTDEISKVTDYKTVGGYGYKMAIGERGEAEGPKRDALFQAAIGARFFGARDVSVVNLARDALSVAIAQRKGFDEWRRFISEWTVPLESIVEEVEAELVRMWRVNRLWHEEGLLAARRVPGVPVEISNPKTGGWAQKEEVDGKERLVASGEFWGCSYCAWQDSCIAAGPGRVPLPNGTTQDDPGAGT